MLREPPAFIRPLWYALADVTGWFNWDALSAIGTVGALWFAVVQFSKHGRVERAREISTITAFIHAMEGALTGVRSAHEHYAPGPKSRSRFQPAVLRRSSETALKRLAEINGHDLIQFGLMRNFEHVNYDLQAAMEMDFVQAGEESSYEFLEYLLGSLKNHTIELYERRGYLQYGPWMHLRIVRYRLTKPWRRWRAKSAVEQVAVSPSSDS